MGEDKRLMCGDRRRRALGGEHTCSIQVRVQTCTLETDAIDQCHPAHFLNAPLPIQFSYGNLSWSCPLITANPDRSLIL